jgi:hypothetical protein
VSAAWAGVIAAFGMLAGVVAGGLWRGGRRDGKVDAVLEHLTAMAADHETRLRLVERIRGRR